MLLNMETMYDNAIKLLDYLTHYYKYNAFILDGIESELIQKLSMYIRKNDRVNAVRLYLKIDKLIDELRDINCYNNPNLPYKSSFRNIAKDAYRYLKDNHLTNNESLKDVAYILKFISTSDYYIIREMLIKKSYSFFMYKDIPLNPDDFYCGYIPLEAILDYCLKVVENYIKY